MMERAEIVGCAESGSGGTVTATASAITRASAGVQARILIARIRADRRMTPARRLWDRPAEARRCLKQVPQPRDTSGSYGDLALRAKVTCVQKHGDPDCAESVNSRSALPTSGGFGRAGVPVYADLCRWVSEHSSDHFDHATHVREGSVSAPGQALSYGRRDLASPSLVRHLVRRLERRGKSSPLVLGSHVSTFAAAHLP